MIGYGSMNENTHGVHGAPLKPEDMAQLREKWGLPAEAFTVKPEVGVGLRGERELFGIQ